MSQLILGYPGCGLITWCSANDPVTVAWVDDVDLANPVFKDETVKIVAGPLTEESFQTVTTDGRPACLIYPADNAIGEYFERQNDELVPEDLVERYTVTQDRMLDRLRADTHSQHRHIVLGRDEYAGDYLTIP